MTDLMFECGHMGTCVLPHLHDGDHSPDMARLHVYLAGQPHAHDATGQRRIRGTIAEARPDRPACRCAGVDARITGPVLRRFANEVEYVWGEFADEEIILGAQRAAAALNELADLVEHRRG